MCRNNGRTTGTGAVPPEERNRIDGEEGEKYTVTEFIKRGYAVNGKKAAGNGGRKKMQRLLYMRCCVLMK